MPSYKLVDRPGEGIAIIERTDHKGTDRKMWSRVKVRQGHRCRVSGAVIHFGEQAYAPTGNAKYRYERIAAAVIDYLPRGDPHA